MSDINDYLIDGKPSNTLVLFAHGAGANKSSDFMQDLAMQVADAGYQVIRFNFPYMRANAVDGKRRPPDRQPKLVDDLNQHIQYIKKNYQAEKIVLMGKSMGGRMSAIVAAETHVDAVICLGYPFIPLKGGEPRLLPIIEANAPLLIIQGERDKFGNKDQVESWPEVNKAQVYWLKDGDHSFKPRKASGASLEGNMQQASDCIVQFLRGLDE